MGPLRGALYPQSLWGGEGKTYYTIDAHVVFYIALLSVNCILGKALCIYILLLIITYQLVKTLKLPIENCAIMVESGGNSKNGKKTYLTTYQG